MSFLFSHQHGPFPWFGNSRCSEHQSVHQSPSQSVIKSVNPLSLSQLVGQVSQSVSKSFRQTDSQTVRKAVIQSFSQSVSHSSSQTVKPISLPDTIFLLIFYGLIKFSLLLPLLQPVFSVSRFYPQFRQFVVLPGFVSTTYNGNVSHPVIIQHFFST